MSSYRKHGHSTANSVILEAVYGRRICHALPRPWQTRKPWFTFQIITSRYALLMTTGGERILSSWRPFTAEGSLAE